MRFSIWPSPARPWDEILELTLHCEATGWDGVYVADHFMPNAPDATPLDGDTLECWSVIAALAALVPRLRLAPLVTSVTYRHPAVLANIAAAVDQISHGRLLLGIGAGWQENEHAAYGLELGTVKQRLDRFEEACAVITSLLREPHTTFAGEYYRVTNAPNQPPPVQPRLPLLIGGAGEKRTMRIAARYADEWNAWSTPDLLAHKVGVLQKHCGEIGRDPSEIRVSTQAMLFLSTDEAWLAEKRAADAGRAAIIGTPSEVIDIVGQYRDAGADELIIPDFTFGPLPRRKETCDRFIEEVASAFRS
jgi:F420-dependent oxidoreductase-like protein